MLDSTRNSSYKPIFSRRARNDDSFFSEGHLMISAFINISEVSLDSSSHLVLSEQTSSVKGDLHIRLAKLVAALTIKV
jgi:hypothetical protein